MAHHNSPWAAAVAEIASWTARFSTAPVPSGRGVPVLELRNLGVRLRDIPAVDGINLTLHAGEALALVGESGCGKSLSSLAVMGLLPLVAKLAPGSSIVLQGRELAGLDEDGYNKLRGRDMSMIFQEPFTSLNPLMTVGAQIMEGLTVHGVSEAEARKRTLDMLDKVGDSRPRRTFRPVPLRAVRRTLSARDDRPSSGRQSGPAHRR